MTSLRRIAVLALAAAAALTTASCTLPPELATRDTTAVGVDTTPVPRDIPRGAVDRDRYEIAAAALAIDPCLMIDPAVASARGITSTPSRQFNGCSNRDVWIETWAPFDAAARYETERLELAGVVAYRNGASNEFCELWVPVSFDAAMYFNDALAYRNSRDCTAVEQYATAAITTLTADPMALNRPDLRDAIDVCALVEQLPSVSGILDVEPAPFAPAGRTACVAVIPDSGMTSALPEFTINFSLVPAGDSPSAEPDTEIASLPATLSESTDSCSASLALWTSTTDPTAGDVVAGIMDDTCGEATVLATELVTLLETFTPLQPTGDPLFFEAGTTDSAAVGACVDVLDQQQRECAPAVDAAVPSGPFKFITAAVADPNVLCTAAAPAVNEIFGADLSPTTVLTQVTVLQPESLGCEFVNPDHTLVVSLQADALTTISRFEALTTAGLPTQEAITPGLSDAAVGVVIGLGDDQPGSLGVSVFANPSRAAGSDAVDAIDPTALDGFDELTHRLAVDLLGGA